MMISKTQFIISSIGLSILSLSVGILIGYFKPSSSIAPGPIEDEKVVTKLMNEISNENIENYLK